MKKPKENLSSKADDTVIASAPEINDTNAAPSSETDAVLTETSSPSKELPLERTYPPVDEIYSERWVGRDGVVVGIRKTVRPGGIEFYCPKD